MTRRVDQIDLVPLPFVLVMQTNRFRFDRNSTLSLEIHRVEQLLSHLANLDRSGPFQKPVGQRALAVINVSNDAKVTNV